MQSIHQALRSLERKGDIERAYVKVQKRNIIHVILKKDIKVKNEEGEVA